RAPLACLCVLGARSRWSQAHGRLVTARHHDSGEPPPGRGSHGTSIAPSSDQSHRKRKWVFMISPARIRIPGTRIGGLRLALIGLALAACAGPRTSVEIAWTAPNAPEMPLHRVVTLFVSRDVALRRPAEDEMARQLEMRGVEATPAYQLLSRDDLSTLNAAKAKLRAQGYDGVVTMRMVGSEQTLNYVPQSFDAYWTWASPYFG